MTTLLALDVATEACSVALLYQGQVYHRYEVIPRLHAQRLLPMIQEVLSEAGIALTAIDALAFGQGPGAFTGIRIGMGVAQGLAFALELPVIPLSDLALIAQRAYREYQCDKLAVAIDARMNEVYWGCYQVVNQRVQLVADEVVIAPQGVKLPTADSWIGVGTGWKYAKEMPVTCQVIDDQLLPDAQDLLCLALIEWERGAAVAIEQVEPVYLRDNVATPKIY